MVVGLTLLVGCGRDDKAGAKQAALNPAKPKHGVLKAAKEAEARGWKIGGEKAGWYLDELKAKGMKVLPPSPALAAGFKKFGEDLTAGWLKKAGADGEAIVAAYRK